MIDCQLSFRRVQRSTVRNNAGVPNNLLRISSDILKLFPSFTNRGRALERPPNSLIKAQVETDQLWLWLQWVEADIIPWTVQAHQVHLSKLWGGKQQCRWLKQQRGVLPEARETVKQCWGDSAKVPSDLKHKMLWLRSTKSKQPTTPQSAWQQSSSWSFLTSSLMTPTCTCAAGWQSKMLERSKLPKWGVSAVLRELFFDELLSALSKTQEEVKAKVVRT